MPTIPNLGTAATLTTADLFVVDQTAGTRKATGQQLRDFLGMSGSGVTDGDKGDITVSSSATVWTVDNDAITFAKMQNLSANTVPARRASSAGDMSECTLSTSQLLGRGSTGDIAAISIGSGLSMSGTTLSASSSVYKPSTYGAVGDGSTNDRTAIQDMIADIAADLTATPSIPVVVDWEGRSYHLGAVSNAGNASGGTIDVCLTFDTIHNMTWINPPRFYVTNSITLSGSTVKYAICCDFIDCRNLKAEFYCEGSTFVASTPQGIDAAMLTSRTVDAYNTELKVTGKNLLALLDTRRMTNTLATRDPADPVWRRGFVDVNGTNCYYGARFVGSGDEFHVKVDVEGHSRSYFPVGVQDHHAWVNSRNQTSSGGNADVLIKAYYDSVINIHLHLNQFNAGGAEWSVSLEHENNDIGTEIRNVHLHVNAERNQAPSGTGESIAINRNFNGSGVLQTQQTNNITDQIFIYGRPQPLQSASPRPPRIVIPTAIGSSKTASIYCECADFVADLKGYTLVRGNTRMTKARGVLNDQTLKIDVRDMMPRCGVMVLTLHMNADFSDFTQANAYAVQKRFLLAFSTGAVESPISSSDTWSILRGAVTPTFTITCQTAGYVQIVPNASSGYASSTLTEISAKLEILGSMI